MPESVQGGTLYLVATPIGNLEDLSPRAANILRQVDGIACEDTRRTLGLLTHLGIRKPLWSYHGHSSARRVESLLALLREGKSVAQVSDAGTPGLSDPGEELVSGAIAAGVPVVSVPGPCAAVAALVASGLPTDRFFFIGFLPRRPARARRALTQAAAAGGTVVIYESPFRVRQTLQWIVDAVGPETRVVLARELTKIHEEYIRGTAQEVWKGLADRVLKGEVVILLHPSRSG